MQKEADGQINPNMVIGVFSTVTAAEAAVAQLSSIGLSPDEVSVISSNEAVMEHFKNFSPDIKPGDWKEAALLGGSTGAVLAGLTSVAALATGAGIPLVVAGGLASFLTGGVVGSLAGAMTERGFETEAADYYELAVSDGKTLVAVDLSERQDLAIKRAEIEQVILQTGAEPIELRKNPDFAS